MARYPASPNASTWASQQRIDSAKPCSSSTRGAPRSPEMSASKVKRGEIEIVDWIIAVVRGLGGQHRASKLRGQGAGRPMPALISRRVALPSMEHNQTTPRAGAGAIPGEAFMAVSLYDLSVPTYLQTLGGVAGFLEK